MFKKLVFPAFLVFLVLLGTWLFMGENAESIVNNNTISGVSKPTTVNTPIPTANPVTIPTSHVIPLKTHVFQSFNNCGPAALSMALSYYGIEKTQEELGRELRPYQIPGGDNDDKSVTLEEVAEKSKEFGLTPYLMPNGNIETLKKIIAMDLPVIARTWLTESEDIGHYRIVRGYSETGLIQDDSLQNKNLTYTYEEFDAIWKKFNYEYLILVPEDKIAKAEQIIGEDLDEKIAWQKAVENAQKELQENPGDIYSIFNLSVAYFNLGKLEESVAEFEKVENQLPFRTLWYQIEPIRAYYELGNYERTLSLIDRVLNYHNKAFSELYIIRGNIYLKQGNREAAREAFEQAVFYNKNLKSASEALNSI